MKTYLFKTGINSRWERDHLVTGDGKSRGGAIFIKDKRDFIIENSFFVFNYVQMDGGCIYLLNCNNVLLKGNVFLLNRAKWGGAIYLERCSQITITDNVFIGNIAIRDGGAISLSHCYDINVLENYCFGNVALRSGRNIDLHHSDGITIAK